MLKSLSNVKTVFGFMLVSGFLVGCNVSDTGQLTEASISSSTDEQRLVIDSLYESHHDGRIYIFHDKAHYDTFRKQRYVDYSLSKVGEGSHGETLVFALNQNDDVNKIGVPSLDLFANQATAADYFYGEVERDGRLYVFNTYQSLLTFRETGLVNNRYVEIHAGPENQTVIYSLDELVPSDAASDKLVAEFKQRHSAKS